MPKKYLPDTGESTDKSLADLTIDAVKLYHSIIHSSPVSIVVLHGKEMVVTVINDACLELWGADKSIIGKSLYDTLPELIGQSGPILQEIYDTGKPVFGNEVPFIVKKNGVNVQGYYDFVWQAKLNDDGKVEGITAIASDVTERALSNKKVKESREQLHILANSMPQIVWMADEAGEVFYYNDRIALYKGAERLDDGKWKWNAIVHPEDIALTSEAWAKSVADKSTYEKEHRLLMKDGTYRWHLSRAIPQKDTDEKVIMWFGTATDIHQQKMFAENLELQVSLRTKELQQAVEDLSDQKKKDEKKDEFISIASHELKTPLAIAQGFLELAKIMMEEKNEEELRMSLDKAGTALKRLNNIIGDFLDVNKMQHGQLLLNYKPFNLCEVLSETADFIKSVFSNRTLVFNSYRQSIIVEGDEERIRHVCSNILTNAMKYSHVSQPVEMSVTPADKQVVVAVKDYGIGIAKEDIPFIFNRYFRVKDVVGSHHGMGIGLFLSAEIIRKHNGTIWVESEKDMGSTFYFAIPLSASHAI